MADSRGVDDADDPGGPVVAHEEMREAVLKEQPCAWRHGYAILAGRGVATWLAARATLCSTPESETSALHLFIPSTPRSFYEHPVALPSPPDEQIVNVLTQMALAHV